MIFNNGQGRGYSSIDIVNPTTDINGNYILTNSVFGPNNADWTYTDSNPQNFYSSYISGAQRLKNGNTLICDGAHGTFFEIDSTGTQVWKYINPVINSGPLMQGDPIPLTSNGWGNPTFRCTRYSPNFSAFAGRDLSPGDFIELNPLPSNCQMILSINENLPQNTNNTLIYITDILGRETTKQPNTLLFYIYDDGTIKKKIIIE